MEKAERDYQYQQLTTDTEVIDLTAFDHPDKRTRTGYGPTVRPSVLSGALREVHNTVVADPELVNNPDDTRCSESPMIELVELPPHPLQSQSEVAAARQQKGLSARWGRSILRTVTKGLQRAKNWFYEEAYFGEVRLQRKKVTAVAVGGLALAAAGVYAVNKFGVSLDDVFGRHEVATQPNQRPLLTSNIVPKQTTSTTNDVFSRLADSIHDAGDRIRTAVPQHSLPRTSSVPEQFSAADQPWDVLSSRGIPSSQIMERLDSAAQQLQSHKGIPFEWHGSGNTRWLEVNGQSDTQSVMTYLNPYLG